MRVDLHAMTTRHGAKGAVDIISLPEVSKAGEGHALDRRVVEEGDFVASVDVRVVLIDGSFYLLLKGSIVGRETQRNVGGIVWDVVAAVVDVCDVVVVPVDAVSM